MLRDRMDSIKECLLYLGRRNQQQKLGKITKSTFLKLYFMKFTEILSRFQKMTFFKYNHQNKIPSFGFEDKGIFPCP